MEEPDLGGVQTSLEKVWLCPSGSREVCCFGQAGAGPEMLVSTRGHPPESMWESRQPETDLRGWSQGANGARSPSETVFVLQALVSMLKGLRESYDRLCGDCKVAKGPHLGPRLREALLNVLTPLAELHLVQKWQETFLFCNIPPVLPVEKLGEIREFLYHGAYIEGCLRTEKQ